MGVAYQVHSPPLAGRHRHDELAATRGGVQDVDRPAQPAMDVARDLPPHRLPGDLVHVAEPVFIEPLKVDARVLAAVDRRHVLSIG